MVTLASFEPLISLQLRLIQFKLYIQAAYIPQKRKVGKKWKQWFEKQIFVKKMYLNSC